DEASVGENHAWRARARESGENLVEVRRPLAEHHRRRGLQDGFQTSNCAWTSARAASSSNSMRAPCAVTTSTPIDSPADVYSSRRPVPCGKVKRFTRSPARYRSTLNVT